MIIYRGNRHNPAEWISGNIHHLYWIAPIRGSSVPQLTIIIFTNRPHRAVPHQINSLPRTTCDLPNSEFRLDGHAGLPNDGQGQLAIFIAAHAHDQVGLGQENGVVGLVPPPHGSGRQKDREAGDEAAAKEG